MDVIAPAYKTVSQLPILIFLIVWIEVPSNNTDSVNKITKPTKLINVFVNFTSKFLRYLEKTCDKP